MSGVPGWYPDPAGVIQLRWWDGSQWTADVRAYSVQASGMVLVRNGDTLRIEKPLRRKEASLVFEASLSDLESIPYVHSKLMGDYLILLHRDPVLRARAREGEKNRFKAESKKERATLAAFLAPIIQSHPGLVVEQTQRQRNKQGSAWAHAALRGEGDATVRRAGERIQLASGSSVPEIFVYEREIWHGSPDLTSLNPVGGPLAGARAELRISGNTIVTSEGAIKTGAFIHQGWTERDRRDFQIRVEGRGFAFDVVGHAGFLKSERDFVSVVNEINALAHAAEGKETGELARAQQAKVSTERGIPMPEDGLANELHRIADLHTRGLLDDDEFRQAKARLLGSPTRSPDEHGYTAGM